MGNTYKLKQMTAFYVGNVLVDPPILLAPMEDVTNFAFRQIAKRIANPGLLFTEFVSSMAIHHKAKKAEAKLRISENERPIAIQIFGGDPQIMAETAKKCESFGADIVDINMGCWVPKVCKTGSGAALLKDPLLAEKIVQSVVNAVKIPVTVKVRAGWSYDLFTAPELAKRFENAGAKMLTLHARFAKQGFDGNADWKLISDLRKAISIPLIGNGDIKCGNDAIRMFRETGCDGVMVGRASIANPWRLKAIIQEAMGLEKSSEPNLRERIETALEHLNLTIQQEMQFEKDNRVAELRCIRALRGQICLYIKGYPGSASLREKLDRAESIQEIRDLLFSFEEQTTLKSEREKEQILPVFV